VKYAWIEAQAGWQAIARLCKVLGVSRSGFVQWRKRGPSDRELANRSLDAQVAVIHAEGKQGYGRIRVTRRLRQSGMRIGAERVCLFRSNAQFPGMRSESAASEENPGAACSHCA
jgi:putative transposase